MKARPKRKTRTKVRQGKIGKTAIALKDSKGNPKIGHDERLQAYMKRATELKMLDYTHMEIAQAMFVEFKMERVPAISTVAGWLDMMYRETDEEMKRIHWQMRFDQFQALERLRSKWQKIALAQELEIQRWINTKEGLQPTIDENAIQEQLKATDTVVKIMARQARLFGLDLEQAIQGKDGPQDVKSMQVWILNQITQMAGGVMPQIQGSSIGESPPTITLELTSGLDELL